MKHRFSLTASSIALALASSYSVQAEQEQTEDIENITVTGQRSYYDRNANTAARVDLPNIETPQSIFVINSDLIADQQAFRFDQVLQNDSSVQKSNNFLGAYSSYQIRGFSLSNGSNYLRDGRAFFHLASVPIEVLDRVEVLKGPSSVLYGTMAPGGLINMIPKRPKAEPFTSLKGTLGSFDFMHAALDHSGVITENGSVRYRINGAYEDSDSFRKFFDGTEFSTQRAIAAVALDWDISERTALTFNFDFTSDDRPQDIGLVSTDGNLDAVNSEIIFNQPWSHYNSEVANYSVNLSHEFSDAISIRTGYSFQDYIRDRFDNQLRGLPTAEGDVNIRARRRIGRTDYETIYADFLADFETGVLSHKLLVGVDKTNIKTDNNETAENVIFATNIFTPTLEPNPNIQTRPEKNLGSEVREGLTIHDVISIGEHWRILLGGRWDNYLSDFTNFGAAVPRIRGETSGNFTPRVGGLYLVNPNLSFYVSYSESFEPNAPVGSRFDNAGEVLDPTLGEQYEAGVKWEALGGSLFVNSAIFSIERSGSPFEDEALNRILQLGTQRHEGIEFGITGLINDSITVNGSGTLLSAEFTKDDDPSIIGNTPAGVADVSLSLTGEYQFLSPKLSGLSLQASVFYESGRPIDNDNSFDLDSYVRFDIGAKYTHNLADGKQLTYRLNALNLLDEEYFKGRSVGAINLEQPRVIRVSAEFTF